MRKNSKNIEKDKIIEIIKIKLILEKIINKKGEKMSKKKIQEDKKITIQTINGNKLNRYEKMKKFRNLENISITYGDKEKDKFKDFQELYNVMNNEIEVQDRKWIYSEKNEIYYFLYFEFITTERMDGMEN